MGLVLKLTKLSNGQSSPKTKIGIFKNLYTNHFALRDVVSTKFDIYILIEIQLNTFTWSKNNGNQK
jgi:hypothetical protein